MWSSALIHAQECQGTPPKVPSPPLPPRICYTTPKTLNFPRNFLKNPKQLPIKTSEQPIRLVHRAPLVSSHWEAMTGTKFRVVQGRCVGIRFGRCSMTEVGGFHVGGWV